MCTNQKYVTNPYTGQRIFVKCGKCPACLQEKADRLTTRINNHCSDTLKVAIFTTLTYDEKFIPYVKRKDIENNELYRIPIYRDYSIRRFKNRDIVRANTDIVHSLCDYISLVDEDTGQVNRENIYFHANLWKKGRGYHPEKMGVIYYHDFQNFKKNLRITLQRQLGARFKGLEFFGTSEYGETHYRPHFHALVFCSPDSVESVISAICQTWKFASRDDVERSTQIGINPAAYVSSYINSPISLPKCFETLSKTKHSFSPSVGVLVNDFSLSKILEKTDYGTLSYLREVKINGAPVQCTLPIPKYVINRYFPLFKGLCRLSTDEVANLLRFPHIGFVNRKFEGIADYNKRQRHGEIVNDVHTNYIRIKNARSFYVNVTHKHEWDFAIDYLRVWNCYKNTLYKLQFLQDIPMLERYDNIQDLKNGYVKNDSLAHLLKDDTETNPNNFSSVRSRSAASAAKYHAKTKISKTNNYIRTTILNKNL